MFELTLLYDSGCNLCRTEMHRIQRMDRAGRIALVDIRSPGFDASHYNSTLADMMGSVHGVTRDGSLLRGMDTVRAAYAAVGRDWLLGWTALPLLRPMFDVAYRQLARHRYGLSRLLGYRRCEEEVCRL